MEEPQQRPLGIIGPVARKAKLTARSQHACQGGDVRLGNKPPFPVPPLRPRIGIEQIDARQFARRQPREQLDGVAMVQPDIPELEIIDPHERLRHAVDERLASDEAGARKRLRFRD